MTLPVFPASTVAPKLLVPDTYPSIRATTYHQDVIYLFKAGHTSGTLEVLQYELAMRSVYVA